MNFPHIIRIYNLLYKYISGCTSIWHVRELQLYDEWQFVGAEQMKWIVDDFWAAPVNNIPVCLTSNWQETDLHSQHLVTTNWWNSCSSAHLMIGATNGHVLLNVVFRKQNETTKYVWQEKWKYLDTFEHAMCNLEDLKRTDRLAVDMDKPCTFIVFYVCWNRTKKELWFQFGFYQKDM